MVQIWAICPSLPHRLHWYTLPIGELGGGGDSSWYHPVALKSQSNGPPIPHLGVHDDRNGEAVVAAADTVAVASAADGTVAAASAVADGTVAAASAVADGMVAAASAHRHVTATAHPTPQTTDTVVGPPCCCCLLGK